MNGMAKREFEETDQLELSAVLERQRRAFFAEGTPTVETRRQRIKALLSMVENGAARLSEAVGADFGNRSPVETQLTDILLVVSQAKVALRRLARWSRARRVPTPIYLWPGTSRVLPQPLGVVGVIGTWNYPVATILGSAICALAAGNRVLVKPSEQAPRTAEVLAGMIADTFESEVMTAVLGGADVSARVASLPFDHLVFTGSAAIGRKVAAAAAANLTPVTLELGGKCPAILDPSCDLDQAVSALLFGKFLNAGQTCIGVDYLLVPPAMQERLISALRTRVVAAFPNWANNPDYTHIVSGRHFARLEELLTEARAKGATIAALVPEAKPNGRAFPPTVVLRATDDMRLLREEIFGPILPIVTCENHEDAIAYINARDKPLALYWFGHNSRIRDQVLARTYAGGVTVNGTVMHVFQQNLGFGGVGASGMGEYLGETGFRRFSKEKPIFIQYRPNALRFLAPPYTRWTDRLLSVFRKLL
jgi:coniferyl-aldehyde dehydrogenase